MPLYSKRGVLLYYCYSLTAIKERHQMNRTVSGWIFALAAFVSATVLAAPARTAELDGAKWIWHPQGARDNQKVTFRAAFDAPSGALSLALLGEPA